MGTAVGVKHPGGTASGTQGAGAQPSPHPAISSSSSLAHACQAQTLCAGPELNGHNLGRGEE